jgi:hypothetical protein
MADMLPARDAEISEDVPCVHCGYNLRGLTRDNFCPECGTPIARSIFGNQLRYADPQWLERLCFGTSLKLWNILIVILVVVGDAVIAAVGLPPSLRMVLGLIGSALGLWAAFLITTPEPRVALQENPITLRRAVRACAVLGLIGGVLIYLVEHGGTPELMAILGIAGGVCMLAGVVQLLGELVYYRRFARRVPNPKLEKSTSTVLWGLPIMYGALVVGWGIMLLGALLAAQNTSASGPSGVIIAGGGVFLCAGVVGLVILGIWYIVLLFSYRKAFQEAVSFAKQFVHQGGAGWAQNSATPLV